MANHIVIKKKINSFKKKIEVSSDKSISIRCILLASIAIGKSNISNLLESEDVTSALKAIKKLGINYKKKKNIFVDWLTNRITRLNIYRLVQQLLGDKKEKITDPKNPKFVKASAKGDIPKPTFLFLPISSLTFSPNSSAIVGDFFKPNLS